MLVDFSTAILMRFSDKLSLLCKWVLHAQESALRFVSKALAWLKNHKLSSIHFIYRLNDVMFSLVSFCSAYLFNMDRFKWAVCSRLNMFWLWGSGEDVKVISGLSGHSSSYFRPLLIKPKPDLCAKDSETTGLSSISLVYLVNESGVSWFPDGYIDMRHNGLYKDYAKLPLH